MRLISIFENPESIYNYDKTSPYPTKRNGSLSRGKDVQGVSALPGSEPQGCSDITDGKGPILDANLLTFLSKAPRWFQEVFGCQDPGPRKHERNVDTNETTIRTP